MTTSVLPVASKDVAEVPSLTVTAKPRLADNRVLRAVSPGTSVADPTTNKACGVGATARGSTPDSNAGPLAPGGRGLRGGDPQAATITDEQTTMRSAGARFRFERRSVICVAPTHGELSAPRCTVCS